MKFIVKQNRFLKELLKVSRVIKTSSANPILQFIKIECDKKGITLLATDETIYIQSLIPIQEGEEKIIREIENGSILIKSQYLNDCIKKLTSKEFVFELVDDIVKIEDENTSYTLKTVPSDEYLDVDFSNEGDEINMKSSEFVDLIDQTCYAASMIQKPNSQAFLTSLNIVCKENKIVFTALDSYKLAKNIFPYNTSASFNINIAASTAIEVSKLLNDTNTLKIILNPSRALFSTENTKIVTQTCLSDFPETDRFIPSNFNYILETNCRDLLNTIDRLIVSSAPSECVVKMNINSDEIQLSTNLNDVGNGETRLTNFKFTGEPFEILFQADYLLDTLKAVKSTDVQICFVDRNKPFVVKNPKDSNSVMIVTPIRS